MSVSQAAERRTWFSQYPTSDVAENLGTFLVRSIHPKEMIFEWILTVKVETSHPVEALFGS